MTMTNHHSTHHRTQHRHSMVSTTGPCMIDLLLTDLTDASPVPLQSFGSLGTPEIPLWAGQLPINADITYSYYPFLSINNLQSVIPQDVNFLESQGCLRIPTRVILDEFMQQYFLHVHPILPFLNEGDFWNLYCNQGSIVAGERMSLLVFQAMLFSCCNVSRIQISIEY